MRIHYLQHVPFEDPANILVWAKEREHRLTRSLLYEGDALPNMNDFDALIVMGGPMSVHDVKEYPWLVQEKAFIDQTIKTEKPILGICLGAQLIAESLGAKVYGNSHKEIGWFPICKTPYADGIRCSAKWPASFTVFHWHGETFDIPNGAVRLASSEACVNQGFAMGDHIIGLQFHLESTQDSVTQLITHGGDELTSEQWIQTADVMLRDDYFKPLEEVLFSSLDCWLK